MEAQTVFNSELKFEDYEIQKASVLIHAVNHKLRQQMLSLMHLNQRVTVTEIFLKLGVEQSVASQQLAILRNANLVHAKKHGKWIFYSVNYSELKNLHIQTNTFLQN